MALNNFKEIQAFITGVKDPVTGRPLKLLAIGDSASSNLILALRGEGPLFNPIPAHSAECQPIIKHHFQKSRLMSWQTGLIRVVRDSAKMKSY